MKQEFKFNVKGHEIRVTNSWFHGAKLYVDGDIRDFEQSYYVNSNIVFFISESK